MRRDDPAEKWTKTLPERRMGRSGRVFGCRYLLAVP